MKKTLLTFCLVAPLGVFSAYADDMVSDSLATFSFSAPNSEAVENLEMCLNADGQDRLSQAIRACTKAYKVSVPIHEIRSDILVRRGLLQLSAGRYDKASRDFKSAAKLNQENEFAYLGDGFAALLKKDYKTAANLFNDCRSHNKAAPLALYGLAMTKEASGDKSGAILDYQQASQMRPDWMAPQEELSRLKTF